MSGRSVAVSASSLGSARLAVLLGAFGCAVALRWALSGASGPRSIPGALAFAVCLGLLSAAVGLPRAGGAASSLLAGVMGALVLVGVPAARTLLAGDLSGVLHRSPSGYGSWLIVAAAVAIAEEAFLRGVLFDAVSEEVGESMAVVVSAVAFASLHVPLYGWGAAPLDLAVGVLLATVRVLAGGWGAAATAHVLADAAGWWLR